MFEDRETLWVIHIGNDDRIALRAKDEGFICIGWTKMGDLSKYPTREVMKSAMAETFPTWKHGKVHASYGQPFRFAHEMKIGDPVVFPCRPTREICIGQITGDYEWRTSDQDLVNSDYVNVRKVKWLKIVQRTAFSQSALYSFGSFTSVSTSNDFLDEVRAVLKGELATTEPDESPTAKSSLLEDDVETSIEASPAELFDSARQATEDYLIRSWQRTGAKFEHVVAAVLRAMNYTATVTRETRDYGVDVVAYPDPLGIDPPRILVQAKSGTGSAGDKDVKHLKGCMHTGDKAVFVSLGGFTKEAESLARNTADIRLVDHQRFVELFLSNYERLDPAFQARFPLKQVFVPQG